MLRKFKPTFNKMPNHSDINVGSGRPQTIFIAARPARLWQRSNVGGLAVSISCALGIVCITDWMGGVLPKQSFSNHLQSPRRSAALVAHTRNAEIQPLTPLSSCLTPLASHMAKEIQTYPRSTTRPKSAPGHNRPGNELH